MSYVAYPNAFIEGVQTDLVLYDDDEDNDLDGYDRAIVTYTSYEGVETKWYCGNLIKIQYKCSDGQHHVRAVIIPVTPPITAPGCLGRLASIFGLHVGGRKPAAGPGSGTVTGTLQTDPLRPPHSTTGTPTVKIEATLYYPVLV